MSEIFCEGEVQQCQRMIRKSKNVRKILKPFLTFLYSGQFYVILVLKKQYDRNFWFGPRIPYVDIFSKVGCVFLMVIVSMLPHAEIERHDHREGASHFTMMNIFKDWKRRSCSIYYSWNPARNNWQNKWIIERRVIERNRHVWKSLLSKSFIAA